MPSIFILRTVTMISTDQAVDFWLLQILPAPSMTTYAPKGKILLLDFLHIVKLQLYLLHTEIICPVN